jgi:hypothetical protein
VPESVNSRDSGWHGLHDSASVWGPCVLTFHWLPAARDARASASSDRAQTHLWAMWGTLIGAGGVSRLILTSKPCEASAPCQTP